MNSIPIIIAKFLALPDVEGFSIYDKFAYLIKSVDGDSYYLCEQLPEEGLITVEHGEKIQEYIESITYEDILKWYKDWD